MNRVEYCLSHGAWFGIVCSQSRELEQPISAKASATDYLRLPMLNFSSLPARCGLWRAGTDWLVGLIAKLGLESWATLAFFLANHLAKRESKW